MSEKKSQSFTVGGVVLSFEEGDITLTEAEAIVNAANNALWMGGGVAGAIKRKGGKIIEEEAISKGPIPVGESVVTGAGMLKAKYVIHAAVMGQDLKTDQSKIAAATQSAMREAARLGVKVVAFPALGTGVGGFPMCKAGEVMVKEIVSAIESGKAGSLREVKFVLFGQEAFSEFLKGAEKLLTT